MPMKRPPQIERELRERFARIPKARWAELYRDLYQQCLGEDTGTAWMDDAENRLEILKNYDAR